MPHISHLLPRRAAGRVVGIATLPLTLACLALAGCASVATVAAVHGDDGAGMRPRLEVVDARPDSLRLAVGVDRAAGAVLLWLVPGRGVTLLRTDADLRWLDAGSRQVAVERPAPSADTLSLVRGRRVRGARSAIDRGAVQAPSRVSIDEQPRRASRYLLLVVADVPLVPARLADALDGMTLPLEPEAALRAVGKHVRAASGARSWSGVVVGARD